MLMLSIVTPSRRVVGDLKVKSISVPGAKGEMTLLPGHARLISLMDTGVLAFEEEGGQKNFAAISHGFVEVHGDRVTVLADTLELAKEIDLERAKQAQQKSEERLKAKESFDSNLEKWQRKLQRSLIRQHVAKMSSEHLLPPH